MEKIKSEYTVKKVKNGLPHWGAVQLTIELTASNTLEIIEKYAGAGFVGQGYLEVLPDKGYDDWKKGIVIGIKYAFSKLESNSGLKVIIEEASGLVTDTNPTILGYAASRAILNKLPNSESETEHEGIKKMVFRSWDYDYHALPNFEKKMIEGEKVEQSKYRKS